MFAFKSKIEIAIRALLIAVILFNALAPTSSVMAGSENRLSSNGGTNLVANLKSFLREKRFKGYSLPPNNMISGAYGYWNFDEESGTIVNDLGSGAHAGTISGTAVRVNGHPLELPNHALQFNG